MKIKIEGGCLDQLAPLAHSYRLFGQTIGIPTTGFDFHKNQIMLMFSNKINLPVTTEKIAFQDAITSPHQLFSSQALTSSAKSMTSYLFWRLCLPLLDTTPLLNRTDYNNYVVCAAMLYTVTLRRGENSAASDTPT